MKIAVKTIMVLFIASLFIFLGSCGKHASSSNEKSDSTKVAAQKFACPMHPEITGKEGDTCSKCGMKLEAVKTVEEKE